MTNYRFNLLQVIGIILLSLLLSIEYYNGVIFTNEQYLGAISIANINEINYLLRTSLWKIHLASGIALFFVFILMYEVNKTSSYYQYLFYLTISIGVSGLINVIYPLSIIHYLHIIFSLATYGIFILIFLEKSDKKVVN